MMTKTVKDYSLHQGEVISVCVTDPLIKALSTITETQYSGIAIVDSSNKLVSNISASDLKGLTKDKFFTLNIPIQEMISKKASSNHLFTQRYPHGSYFETCTTQNS